MHIVKVTDGLGNQMFQYAFARKLQIITGNRVCLDTRFINHEDKKEKGKASWFENQCGSRELGLDKFRINLDVANEIELRRWGYLNKNNDIQEMLYYLAKSDLWFTKYANEYDTSGIEILQRISRPTYFEGTFFDLDIFHDIRGTLQKDFCLAHPMKLSQEVKGIMEQDNTVALHIRKGDFANVGRDISQSDYYVKAIELINKMVENPCLLIFSDDIQWVKNNMKINNSHMYVSEIGLQDYQELTIMKHCKHSIIANSTFSYWAAYLNDNQNKVVICPKGWRNNIIPEEWIKL